MKTNQLWVGILLATAIFSANAQTNLATSTITSRGLSAGTLGSGNSFFGYGAGANSTGGYSTTNATFIGHQSGAGSTGGANNTFLGHQSGYYFNDGSNNTFLGAKAGYGSSDNSGNVSVGVSAGYNSNSNYNTFVGYQAGYMNYSFGGNVFLGSYAGYNEQTGGKLYIDNSNTSTPLIWGDFSADQLKFNGKVGIGLGAAVFPATAGGLDVSTYKLVVSGGILATQVRVATTWADYVFANNYSLPKLSEVDAYIKQNGHLPNMPSAKVVEAQGIEIGDMAKMQQEKIEELTLYAIQQQKQIEKQQQELDELKAMVEQLAASKQ